jgi:hypothetical protein
MAKLKRSVENLTILELEARMRPGSWSIAGFLGSTESLETVIAQDAHTLLNLGMSYKQIADAIETILLSAREQEDNTSWDVRRFKLTDNSIEFQLLCNLDHTYHFAMDSLPDIDAGYLVGHFQVFIIQTKGYQECPWECDFDHMWGSFTFLILNRKLGEYLITPGLIIHLIREHQFFEGVESPYRVDPVRTVRVLELTQKRNETNELT